MKIVMIGAGSYSFGRGQIADIINCEELRNMDVTLSLVDISEENLDRIYQLALKLVDYRGSNIKIEKTTERTEALPGADYVLTCIAVKRDELWEQDFLLGRAYGIKHQTAENGGPGALFHAMRNFNMIIPICRDIEKLCPDAFLMNFTNPEARILHSILTLTSVKAAGFCHGVFMAINTIAKIMDRPKDSFKVTSAGINHLFVVKNVIDKDTGKDIIEEVKKKALTSVPTQPLFQKMLEVFDVFLFPADGHIGEYLPFASEFTGLKWSNGRETKPIGQPKRKFGVPLEEILKYSSGEKPVDDVAAAGTEELTVPIICDIELNRGTRRASVNVKNTGGYVSNLQKDGVIEIPAMVDKEGIHPEDYGEVPEPFAAFMRRQLDINIMATEAFRTRSRKLLLQTLLIDPFIDTVANAEALLNDYLWIQKDYLPEFE